MTVQIDSTRIRSDRTPVSAVGVGGGLWVVRDLPGRQLHAEQALNVVLVADAIDRHPPIPPQDPLWRQAERWARSAGLSAREAVLLLGLDYPAEYLPVRVEPETARPADPAPPRPPLSARLLTALRLTAPEGALR